MSARDLPEPGIAFEETLRRSTRRTIGLQRTIKKRSRTQARDCTEVAFPATSWNLDQTMVEYDIDPGAWLLRGVLRNRQEYTGAQSFGVPQEKGSCYARHILSIYTRPPGSAVNVLARQVVKTPLTGALPDRGVANFGSEYVMMRASVVVSSEAGLTVSMAGRFEFEGSPPYVPVANPFWLGPGTLIARPL